MKLFGLKIVALLIVLLLAPMILPGPDGRPIMRWDDWIPRDTIRSLGKGVDAVSNSMDAVLDTTDASAVEADTAQVYRWRDADGKLHFSDTPVDGAEAVHISGNTLEIPSKNFVEHGMQLNTRQSGNSGARSILLRDTGQRSASTGLVDVRDESGPSLSDIEALTRGDFSNAADVLQNLPALLEQAKQARKIDPEDRH